MDRQEDVSRLLREEVAVAHVEAVFDAITTFESAVEGIYLVGGAVRDVLLGEPSFDIDLAVEGDAIAFGGSLAAALGGRFTPHQTFGTAVVQYGDGERLDVVTTRSERYHAPGALPTVEPAPIQEDLGRRDFTINAMAVSLRSSDFGRLVDPFGGREDLERGVVRVLHDRSFVDDPTRILRAVRYEERYGFRLDDHSAELVRRRVADGLVEELSSSRLRDELVALLEDPAAARGFGRMGDLGVDHAMYRGLRADEPGAELFTRVLGFRDELSVAVPAWRLGVAILARELTADDTQAWLEHLEVRKRDVDRVAAAVALVPAVVARLRRGDLAPSDVVALVDAFAPDVPLLALALDDLPQLREYFTRLRGVALEIGGAELLELGLPESPRVGEVLAELRRRKLDGKLDGRESELTAARELLGADDRP
jgi:tRNA nucleotidyltransferase (CCA-adding enzyme)